MALLGGHCGALVQPPLGATMGLRLSEDHYEKPINQPIYQTKQSINQPTNQVYSHVPTAAVGFASSKVMDFFHLPTAICERQSRRPGASILHISSGLFSVNSARASSTIQRVRRCRKQVVHVRKTIWCHRSDQGQACSASKPVAQVSLSRVASCMYFRQPEQDQIGTKCAHPNRSEGTHS